MKNNRQLNIIFATVLLIVVVISMGIYVEMLVKERVENYCYSDLKSASVQTAQEINTTFSTGTAKLAVIAEKLSAQDCPDVDVLSDALNNHRDPFIFKYLVVLYPDNTVLTSEGITMNVADQISFADEVKKGAYVSGKQKTFMYDDKFVIKAAIPVVRNGQTIAVLYGVIPLQNLSVLYQTRAYDGNAELYIIDAANMDFLLDTFHRTVQQNFNDFANHRFENSSLTEVMDNMQNYRGGDFSLVSTTLKEPVYFHYEPLKINNWYIIVSASKSVAFKNAIDIEYPLKMMLIISGGLMLLYLVYIIHYFVNDIKSKDAQLRQINYMFNVEKLLFNAADNDVHITDALNKVRRTLNSECAFLLTTKDSVIDKAYCVSNIEKTEQLCKRYFIGKKLENYIVKEHIINRQTISSITDADTKHYIEAMNIYNLMCIPVIDDSNNIYALLGVANNPDSYTSTRLLNCVSISFTTALKSIAAYNKIKEMGIMDANTGLKNRNAFMTYCQQYTGSTQHNIGCIYTDVNGLHEINNRLGHSAGDAMLQTVATELQSLFGKEYTYRVGGDEFVAFWPDSTEEELMARARQFQRNVELQGYHVSIGCVWEAQLTDIAVFLKTADARMFEDKAAFYRSRGERRRSENNQSLVYDIEKLNK